MQDHDGVADRLEQAEYAKRECSDCHIILPANRMVKVTDQVLTGVSRSSRSSVGRWNRNSYSGTRNSNAQGQKSLGGRSTSRRYKIVQNMICLDCKANRSRKAMLRGIRNTIVLSIGGTALYIFSLSTDKPVSEKVKPVEVISALPDREDKSGDLLSSSELSEQPKPLLGNAANDSNYEGGDRQVEQATDTTEIDPNPQTDIDRVIANASLRALNGLGQGMWRLGPVEGYVVASDTQDNGTEVCRAVLATQIIDQSQQQVSNQIWCKSISGGEWIQER